MERRLKMILSSLLGLAILWLALTFTLSALANFQAGNQAAGWRDSVLALAQLSIAVGVLRKALTGRP